MANPLGRTKDFPWEKTLTCSCGRPSIFKAYVQVYRKGTKPRIIKTGSAVPVCDVCVEARPLPAGVAEGLERSYTGAANFVLAKAS